MIQRLGSAAIGLALLGLQAGPAAPPRAQGAVTSSVQDQQDGSRSLDLRLGQTVTFTFDGWKPVLSSVAPADAAALAARIPAGLDPTLPETRTPYGIAAKPGATDPHPLNHAAPGTVVMTLAPHGAGTLLLVENGLATPFRYHAATASVLPDGRFGGRSTTLCPARPAIGTVETWAARFDALLIVKFEAAGPDDMACHM